ncbi:unnamed protein product [Moneuplotes crassus]|uniref:Uncharacterized protein n=1 Tax=Euplotes crassus TaxID=5936 RepID=A0AAD1Y052_EUPCR|nr:unnamed protein product [Moneuplotes crassus]
MWPGEHMKTLTSTESIKHCVFGTINVGSMAVDQPLGHCTCKNHSGGGVNVKIPRMSNRDEHLHLSQGRLICL